MYSSETVNAPAKYFQFILDALKGKPHDFTKGSLRKAVILLAIPMIIEMSMESVFALVDLYFVGRLGKHAISTVGLTESVLTVVYSLAIGLSMAATAIVARRIGEKNEEGAARAAAQALLIGFVLIAAVTLTGFIFSEKILRLMGAEPKTIAMGLTYTKTIFASCLVIVMLFLINGILRGAGNPAVAMKSVMLANLLNIILCPLLINGWGPVPAFGLLGAALATTIGRFAGVMYQVHHLYHGRGAIKILKKYFSIDKAVIRSIVTVAWPATLQFIIGSCSWIFMANLVAQTGHSAASAGYQTAIRIIMFFLLPAWGISNASATLVGQNLGAGEFKRAEQSVYTTARYNSVFMCMVSVLFFFAARPIASFFTTQQEILFFAVQALRIVSLGYIFYGVGMVMTNAFNGAGDSRTPTVINIFAFWVVQIPLAYMLARHFEMGPTGVFISIPVAEVVVSISAFIMFRKGKWKKTKV